MAEKMLKTTSYLNPKTGEITEHKSYVDMIFDDEAGYVAWAKKKAIKTYIDMPLPKAFSWAEKGKIEALRHYILRDNQFLVYRSGNAIKPMGVQQIGKLLDMSENRTKIFIRKLKHHSVIKEVSLSGVVYYSFNPMYGIKDKRITLTLFLIFQEELKGELPPWVVEKFLEQAEELKPQLTVIK